MAIELLHADCMEYMATLPDKAFDEPGDGYDKVNRDYTRQEGLL